MTQVVPKVLPWNHTKVLLSTKCEGGYAFNFKLPKEGLSLRSVRITNGVPELVFTASRNVPTIQEDDVATVFRLAQENQRPEFYYRSFPPAHPLEGRWFKLYSPSWLRWTGIGKLLADADWNMKCLHVGARSNEEKTVFLSWAFSSKLDGIASHLDFPSEKIYGSVIMSCDHVKVQMNENELTFPQDPKIIITAERSKLYSKYISDIFPNVAYHDEPKFLKIQEVIKLIVAVEWLCRDKGVQLDQDWIMKQTSKLNFANGATKASTSKLPPSNMIPKLFQSIQPKTDVAVQTWEAQMNASMISKCGTKRLYGILDKCHSEAFLCEEDGTPVPTPISLKFRFQHSSPLSHVTTFCSIPFTDECLISDQLLELQYEMLSALQNKELKYPSAKNVVHDVIVEERSVKVKESKTQCQHPPIAKVVATVDDFDLLYEGIDPNWPIFGVYPNVDSWKELITELSELPPIVIEYPLCALLQPISYGGVSTRQIPIHQVESAAECVREPVTMSTGVYSSTPSQLTVQATNTSINTAARTAAWAETGGSGQDTQPPPSVFSDSGMGSEIDRDSSRGFSSQSSLMSFDSGLDTPSLSPRPK